MIRPSHHNPPAVVLAALAIACTHAGAPALDVAPPQPRLLTSDPERDWQPAVAPDRHHVVFTSERTGNSELFVIDLDDRLARSPRPLAPHPAEDTSPAISPDGKWVAFISTREDALGDVYVVSIDGGEPRRLTARGSSESAPRWVPGRRAGSAWVVALSNPAGAEGRQVAFDEARGFASTEVPPIPPPPPGQLVVLHPDDTNGDGVNDEADDGTVAEQLEDGRLRTLTYPIPGANAPARVRGSLLLSGVYRNGSDLLLYDAPFPVAELQSSAQALELGDACRDQYPGELFRAVSAYRAGIELGGDDGPRCALKMLNTLLLADRPEQARREVQALLGDERFAGIRVALQSRDIRARLNAVVRSAASETELRAAREAALKEWADLPVQSDPAAQATTLLEIARVHMDLGEPEQTIDVTGRILALGGEVEPITRGRAELLRAQVYRTLGVPEETSRVVLQILHDRADLPEITEAAAFELTGSVVAGAASPDAKIRALRELDDRSRKYPVLHGATNLDIAGILSQQGRQGDAAESYRVAMAPEVDNLRINARAAFGLASLLASQGKYEEAIEALSTTGEAIRASVAPGAIVLQRDLHDRLVQEFLRKGDDERRLGDVQLATSTFADLIKREPTLTEAWRGYIDCLAIRRQLAPEYLDQLRRAADAHPRNPLEQYKYGLALSYSTPLPDESYRRVEAATILDGTNPFYHQTLGYLCEQIGRTNNSPEHRQRAFDEYQRAMAMMDPAGQPEAYARILINNGNAAFALERFERASDFYQRRLDQGIPFDDPRTEFLLHRSYGIAAFRASTPRIAMREFRDAADNLEAVEAKLKESVAAGRGKNDPRELQAVDRRIQDLRLELKDRLALAAQEAGDLENAGSLFEEVSSHRPENSLDRVRADRNRAILKMRLADRTFGSERRRLLGDSAEILDATIARLEKGRLRASEVKSDSSAALFTFDFTVTSNATTGGAALDIDQAGEERLVRGALAQVQEKLGNPRAATEQLERQIALQPALTDGNRAYILSSRVVSLCQLAGRRIDLGLRTLAAGNLVDALKSCRFEVGTIPQTNTNGASIALARLGELSQADVVPFGIEEVRSIGWLKGSTATTSPVEALDGIIAALLDEKTIDARGGRTPLVTRPEERVRLLLARAMACERLGVDALAGSDPLAAAATATPHFLQARAFAQEVIDTANRSATGGDVNRACLNALALQLRLAVRAGDEKAASDLRQRAVDWTERIGRADLTWWVHAQESLVAPSPSSQSDSAEMALRELEDVIPGSFLDGTQPAFELMRHLELAMESQAVGAGHWEDAWSIAERWSAARRRVMMDSATPVPRGTEESLWLERALQLREERREVLRRLQALPPVSVRSTRAVLADLEGPTKAWVDHLHAGKAKDYPTASVIWPDPQPFSSVQTLLEMKESFPQPIALVFCRNLPGGTRMAAWTPEGRVDLDQDHYEGLSRNAAIWLVMGDRIPGHLPPRVRVVQMLDASSLLRTLGDLRVATELETARVPGADAPLLQRAGELNIADPVTPSQAPPYDWAVGASGMLGDILTGAENALSVELRIDQPVGGNPVRLAAQQEGLVAAFAGIGARQVILPGDNDVVRHLGISFTPAELPERAREELDAERGRAAAYFERGEMARVVAPLRNVISLSRALETEEGVEDALRLMVQVRRALQDWPAATDAAQAVVDWREAHHAASASLAVSLQVLGAAAGDGRMTDRAVEAYARALKLLEEAGDTSATLDCHVGAGIALETGGRYAEALEHFQAAADAAMTDSDKAHELRRVGRIRLIRQSDFARAEEAFTEALHRAQAAGDAELQDMATLDLARVAERTSRYDASLAMIDAVIAGARPAGREAVLMEALLLRANVTWLRGDYFAAFKAQSEALGLTQRLKSPLNEVVARNAAGLLHWALNDTAVARGELGRALEIARREKIDSEVVTTLINLSLVERSEKKFDAARGLLDEALSAATKLGNAWAIANARRNVGITLVQAGQPAEAIPHLEEAATLAGKIGDRTNAAKARLFLADARRATGDLPAARKGYEEVLADSRDIPLPEVSWRAEFGLAQLLLTTGDSDGAAEALDRAIAVVDGLRAAIKVEEFQDGFLLDKQEIYNLQVRVLLDRGDVAGALEASDRSRGRNFIDLLGNQKLELSSSTDQMALAREAELRARVEELERRLSVAPNSQRPALKEQLEAARGDYAAHLEKMRAENPQLSGFVHVDSATVTEMQQLLDEGEKLVVYHVLDDQVVAWVVAKDAISVSRVGIPHSELATRVQAVRTRLQGFAPVDTELAQLAKLLIEPLQGALQGATVVGIVPHRELHGLPFAALPLGTGALIDAYPLFYIPSVSVLRYTTARRQFRPEGAGRVLAIGNPDIGARQDLPFAQKEAERMGWTFPDATVVTGAQATETWLDKHISDYSIIHIASHGEYDPEHPLFSALKLAPDPKNDGTLTAQEVFSLSLRADLVALSACQSGLGRPTAGDDIVGLNRAFVYAGTREILSSLWRVDDISTAVLVKHFYRNLSDSSRAEALRQAQLRVRGQFPHPAHWAGMCLSGDWQ